MLIALLFSMEQHTLLTTIASERACVTTLQAGHTGLAQATQGVPFTFIGENLAFDYQTDQEILTAWIQSTPHRTVLLNNYTHFGIGRCNTTVVLLLGK